MQLSQEVLEMSSLSFNTQLNTALHARSSGVTTWISRRMLSRNSSSVRGLFM
jgi:hypothetical protein